MSILPYKQKSFVFFVGLFLISLVLMYITNTILAICINNTYYTDPCRALLILPSVLLISISFSSLLISLTLLFMHINPRGAGIFVGILLCLFTAFVDLFWTYPIWLESTDTWYRDVLERLADQDIHLFYLPPGAVLTFILGILGYNSLKLCIINKDIKKTIMVPLILLLINLLEHDYVDLIFLCMDSNYYDLILPYTRWGYLLVVLCIYVMPHIIFFALLVYMITFSRIKSILLFPVVLLGYCSFSIRLFSYWSIYVEPGTPGMGGWVSLLIMIVACIFDFFAALFVTFIYRLSRHLTRQTTSSYLP